MRLALHLPSSRRASSLPRYAPRSEALPASDAPHARHAPRSARAFTLVEILIALGILSLVLAAIYSSWTAILRASKVGLDAAAAVQRARMASRVIEEALGSAQSFALNLPYYSFLAENGDDASLEFTTHLSPSFPRSGKFVGADVRRVRFYLKQSTGGGRELVLSQMPLLMDMDKDEKNYPLVLAKNVKEFKTEFWDLKLQDWVDEWKATNQLPQLVRVTLKMADNAYSSQVREQVTRIVSLPAMTVQPGWQMPRMGNMMPGMPGQPIPGQPLPGQLPPGQQYAPGFIPGQGGSPPK